ncbi:hypothetical protein ACFCVU_27150 [Peribacillus butanolivorans]
MDTDPLTGNRTPKKKRGFNSRTGETVRIRLRSTSTFPALTGGYL